MFNIKNEAERATVYIYGTIGEDWWSPEDENRAKEFAQTLDALSPKPLDIRIDSSGGDVYEGFAIASAINRYAGETHVYIDGLAASAASYIALMADTITMNDFAMLMIHNAWAVCAGNRDELREMADRLEGIDGTIAGIISARSALTREEALEAMSAETWYSAEDAEAAGMCDEIVATGQRIAARIDPKLAARYRCVPEAAVVLQDGEPDAEEIEETPDGSDAAAVEDDAAEDASHSLSTIANHEAKDAEGAFLLGNRVYRKETRNEDK
jgi:ATP-dependent Clp protease protease subunit